MHISLDSALGRQRRLNSVGESVLQIAPDAAAAYSLRSLTGGDPDVVRVRRDSDNTERDFAASQIESGEMTNWVGAGNDGFVQTWYDQSGNEEDLVQISDTHEPKIVSSGNLINGGLRFDDNQFLETTNTFTYGSGTTLSTFITTDPDADEGSYLFRFSTDYIIWNTGGGVRRVNAGVNANAGNIGANEELWTTISELNTAGGASNFYADGTLVSAADAPIGTKTVLNKVLNIGGSGATTHWNGTVNEVIFYATDQSSKRTDIEANIINYYGI